MCNRRQNVGMFAAEFPEETVREIGGWLREAQRVVVFTGAGISTASGIPDFRGPNGLWTTNPLAEKTSTLSYYLNDPEVRKAAWEGRLRTWGSERTPNDGHRALLRILEAGKLSCVITQNVDGLHQESGIPDELVYELHGTLKFARCWSCNDRRPMPEFIDRVRNGEEDPHCELCGGIVKSDAILFEQSLVPEVLDGAMRAAGEADLLLAVGSTLGVSPANNAVPRARAGGGRVVIINGEPTEMDRFAHAFLMGDITAALQAVVATAWG